MRHLKSALSIDRWSTRLFSLTHRSIGVSWNPDISCCPVWRRRGGAWQVYSHRRWVTASCFTARCSTSGLAAIGRDEPWWWDLSVLLGITNKTDSPMFYRHRCSDNDTERRIYLRGPEHINTNEMYPYVAVCHCQKSLKNSPMDDFSSVMKLQWTFDSDGRNSDNSFQKWKKSLTHLSDERQETNIK